ncbi:hypothetical protein CTEN210_11303 [Chaetoceros tenuissimus]|uniref:J domain-containing protein n=1 Tax=Chaetoceros tenuissimus TaxID=426638 RepID=A0AAD3H8S7_9STRA|nr:hypothetical protein CTEN210_11303 [Chaetoceros tenuissimus]
MKLSLFYISSLLITPTAGFCHLNTPAVGRTSSTSLCAGMGMGGGTKSKKKKGGKKAAAGPKFDVAKACLKSEKIYDKLLKEQTKIDQEDNDIFEYITAEYMITARIKPSDFKDMNIPGAASVSDWVPVAQMALKRHVDEPSFDSHIRDCERVRTAVSYYCREISYLGTLAASIFKSIPRSSIEYAAEPLDSFYKFVYEDIIEGKNEDSSNENTMSKAEARKVLELEEGCNDASEIKAAYRKLSFKLHPDRLVGKDISEEESKQAAIDFAKVKLAYESMSSGVRGDSTSAGKSWYESLGGRARTDFGKLTLLPMADAKEAFEKGKYESAVAGLLPDTVMAFVTRNQAATR